VPKRCEVFSSLFCEHFFLSAPKMQLALRLEFLEFGTDRYIFECSYFFQNLTRTKYAGLNLGCGGRSGLPSWRRRRLVSEAAAGAAAATTAGKAGAAGAFVAEASRRRAPRAQRRRRPRRVSYRNIRDHLNDQILKTTG
jgi:hypothetical protein